MNEPATRASATRALLFAIALAALLVHAASYLPFLADDALITLRYARRFVEGAGLTWNDGERVEGYSNLLWLLACAALGKVGVDLIVASRLLGVAASAATVAAILRLGRRPAIRAWPAFAGAMSVALSGAVAAWTIAGLEEPLVLALTAWALVRVESSLDDTALGRGAWLGPGVPLALLAWTRPDGVVLAAGIALGVVAARGVKRAALAWAARLLLLPLLACAAQLAFRLAYYHDWLPNPAYAKVAFTPARLAAGLQYLGGATLESLPVLVLAIGALWLARDPASRRRARFHLAPLLTWASYVAVIGGDFFPARRHTAPLVMMLALLIGVGLDGAVTRFASPAAARRRAVALAGAAAAVLLACFGVAQARDPENARARAERWEWHGRVVARLLVRAFAEQRPRLATDAGGTLPYFSEFPSIDMLGLNDRWLARHRPADFGSGKVGHELGDGAYVLGREPDLVILCGPWGGAEACFRSGAEMVADSGFHQRYRLIAFEGRDPYSFLSRVWVRAEGGRLGITREAARVVVPGFLLAFEKGRAARLDSEGRLVVPVTPDASGRYEDLPLAAGRWRLSAESRGAPAAVAWRPRGGAWSVGAPGAPVAVSLERPGTIDLAVTGAGADTSDVRTLLLERAP